MQAAAGVRPTGCLKCGKQGHWARDCQAPRSEWIPPQESLKTTGPEGENAAQLAAGASGLAPPAAGKAAKPKKRKLSLEILKEVNGLPEVFHTFPHTFRKQCRGAGHELGDLRRLLEMFQRWQDRIMPGVAFDTFIADIERLSGTHSVRHELHEMRMNLLKIAQDALRPVGGNEAEHGVDAVAGARRSDADVAETAAGRKDGGDSEDDLGVDDDEFLELLRQPVEQGVGDSAELEAEEFEDLAIPEDDDEEGGAGIPCPAPRALGEEQPPAAPGTSPHTVAAASSSPVRAPAACSPCGQPADTSPAGGAGSSVPPALDREDLDVLEALAAEDETPDARAVG